MPRPQSVVEEEIEACEDMLMRLDHTSDSYRDVQRRIDELVAELAENGD